MKTQSRQIVGQGLKACLLGLGLLGMTASTACVSVGPPERTTVPKPLVTDLNELHWRMYYQDQFDAYGKAPPPDAGAPDVAWTSYMAEKDSYAIRENNRLLKKQIHLQEEKDKKDH